jgi:hypothetical protein
MMLPLFENCILSGEIKSSNDPVGMLVIIGKNELLSPGVCAVAGRYAPFFAVPFDNDCLFFGVADDGESVAPLAPDVDAS